MRWFCCLLFLTCSLLLSFSLPARPVARSQSLAALLQASRWRQRVLLLCAPTPDDASLRRQRQLLESDRSGLAARDLLVRELIISQLPASDRQYLAQRLSVSGRRFTLLLLGKDGGVKRRDTQPTPAATLFGTIDAMPMRRQEMRRTP